MCKRITELGNQLMSLRRWLFPVFEDVSLKSLEKTRELKKMMDFHTFASFTLTLNKNHPKDS